MKTFSKPLCFLDIESATVGPRPDPAKDKIVHLYMYWLYPSTSPDERMWMFNPGFMMRPENIEVHGITNDMARGYPMFNTNAAKHIASSIYGCDIVGFNHTNYDIPLMWEECNRVDVTLALENSRFVDVGTIFKLKEERSLAAALKFYCGREHTGSHDCRQDVKATMEVFFAQLERYQDLGKMSADDLANFSQYEKRVDLAGKIVVGPDGDPVYNFGNSKGVKVLDDRSFAYWMLNKDFSENTKRALRKILGMEEESKQDRLF